ncbi:Prosaposin [Nibea albiflora]|uniref:Prosaposin n=1 Tax=Nibea albiflora TaxID=240163 RepID=A0ACB7FCX9_NIBAL|nr:Prosaposin [Nibea albiflora]
MSAAGLLLVILAVSAWPECSQIVQLSANMISSRDTKETMYETLHALCQVLPKEQASECDSQVKTYLPKVLQQTPGHLKPGDTCMVFGLCPARKEEELLRLPHLGTDKDTFTSAVGSTTDTRDALIKIMEEVCDLVPHSYKEQCDDFVAKYGTQIVEFLLSSAAPYTICTLLHLCLFNEQPVPEVIFPSDCESCRTLAVLSRLHLGPNSTEPVTSSFLQSVCAHHPNAIPKCEAFTRIYGSRLQKVLGDQMDRSHPCENQAFCKKYMWKK